MGVRRSRGVQRGVPSAGGLRCPPEERIGVGGKPRPLAEGIARLVPFGWSNPGNGDVILIIDNYDSFVYNLAQYIGELGWDPVVYRNDQVTLEEIEAAAPSHIVISPGPGTPLDAGISNDVVLHFAGRVPVLGVCLGHQCIGHVYGGLVVRGVPTHGKTSMVHHDGRTVFTGLPNPFEAGRYHSLVIRPDTVPDVLEVSGRTEAGEIMGVRHCEYVVEGVQFHPESILTDVGHDILRTFLGFTSPSWVKEGDVWRA